MSFYCFFTIKGSAWSQNSSSSSLVVQTKSLEVHILLQWSEWPLDPEEQLHPLHLHLAAVARQQAALPECARVLQVGTNRIFHNILCVSAVCTVSATKAVSCLWLVNWNSYEPAQPITEADSLGRRQSVYISTHIAQTTNVVGQNIVNFSRNSVDRGPSSE